MDQKLEELVKYIVRILPQAKSISNLHKDSKAGIVTFNWNFHKFVVKPSLEVLEIKGTNLFITGASILMQAAFTKYEKNNSVVGAMDDTLRQVEDFLNNKEIEKGLDLLKVVKGTLERIIGRKATRSLKG